MALLTFQLDYHTAWGQQVCICGSLPQMGEFDESKALELTYDGNRWFTDINVSESTEISYYYFIKQGSGILRREWGENRKVYIIKSKKQFLFQDLWKDKPYHSYLYSSVFSDTLFRRKKSPLPTRYFTQSILLNVICPYVRTNQVLCISGDNDALGNWELSKALPLTTIENGIWQIVLDAKKLPAKCSYKFVIIDKATGEAVYWEDGGNRILYAVKAHKNDTVFAETALVFHYNNFKFKGIGTSIPVFSLKTDNSFGIGDFSDLRKMVDWVSLTGQHLIQLLPVNDTTTTKTWRDSYPYSAISINALHPIYLGCNDYPLKNKKKYKSYINKAAKLNSLSQVDYEKVYELKESYSRDLFKQEGEKVLSSKEYTEFHNRNRYWLFAYACYCYLRDKSGSAKFTNWGEYSLYDEKLLQKMIEESAEAKHETSYYCFVQYLLHKQFSGVKEYAHSKGISLKGDIPIGIDRDSIDAWTDPHLFNMDTQTGAPPDDFSYFGQNWGFPTYNWKAMEDGGYAWWIGRFKKMSDYFDAYRIDHILGFFRIWEIPLNAVQGLLGYFNPALPYWAEEINNEGIPFDEKRMVEPFIHEHFLNDIFGEYTEEVKNEYLDVSGWELFKLKPFCNTQQKIKSLFADKDVAKNNIIREGLYSLCTEVLFVRDPNDRNRYHPRITAQYTYSYKYLDQNVKEAFNRLYDRFYFNKHNYFWREQAMKKLPPLISSTNMMVCGEDLGMVPDCVPSVMDELQILSLEIERMPKSAQYKFTNLATVPYLSVCTTSTHDMSPIRLWWTENRDVTQLYYNQVLQLEGEAPQECSTQLCRMIVENHLRSNAMWVILPWQDWLSVDSKLRKPDYESERINVPANPNNYWRYKMHISLDDLLKESEFNETIRNLGDSVK
ncbi:MAG TPA: 4-alpha-glucanotransferase [Fermentimonas sp.]|nr:4-alpha-glucanotransferase [Fermentimonas sp.]